MYLPNSELTVHWCMCLVALSTDHMRRNCARVCTAQLLVPQAPLARPLHRWQHPLLTLLTQGSGLCLDPRTQPSVLRC